MVVTMALTGCGGGGGGGSSAPVPAPTPTPAKSLSFSTQVFTESAANDGSISNDSIIILVNETFTGNNGDNWSALVTNVPAGLTASLIKTSANTATLSFSGKAAAHTSANDITNLSVIFSDAQFTGGSAAQVAGAATGTLSIHFSDPAPPPPVPVSILKGFWAGTQNGTTTSAIVLSSGEAWIVQQDAGGANRFSRSQLTPTSSAFSGSGTQYNLLDGTNGPMSIIGTYVEKSLLSGTVTVGGVGAGIQLSYNNRYETVAQLADAAGTWQGTYSGGSKIVTITIAQDGAVTGSSSSGCSYDGVLQPRTSDPAVFDLAFTERCLSAVTALSGIATVNEAKTSLSWAFTTIDRTAGGLFVGQK